MMVSYFIFVDDVKVCDRFNYTHTHTDTHTHVYKSIVFST